jgi:hypothetical protein
MRRILLAAVLGTLACSCGFDLFGPARATPPPFCAAVGALGSVHLDYGVAQPTALQVTAIEAERAARTSMGIPDSATTCSVRLARYDNLSVHVPTVWVVHLDGLAIDGIGGGIFTGSGPRPSPPVIRRMLVIVSTDAPTLLLSIGTGE